MRNALLYAEKNIITCASFRAVKELPLTESLLLFLITNRGSASTVRVIVTAVILFFLSGDILFSLSILYIH